MSKSKIVWVLVGSLVLIGGVAAGIYLVMHNQKLAELAAPATTLSISPGSQNKSAGDSFSSTVEMNTGQNQSMGFDLVIDFNPQTFQINSVSSGSSGSDFTVIRNNVDNTGGKILYSAFTTDTTKALNGSGLGILSVSGIVKPGAGAGTYNFTFDSGTVVVGYQENQNVLMGTTPGSFVVAGGATTTPTPAPTQTPEGTSTPTPTATPTGTSSPTGTPNSCGGTCGSNDNCVSSLYCYQGFCRNSSCPTQADCNCPAGPTPARTSRPLPVTGSFLPTVAFGIAGLSAIIISLFAVIF